VIILNNFIEKIINGISIEDYYHLLAEYDCSVVETSLPGGCKGFTMKNQNDLGYVIYLNNDLSVRTMIKTLKHELKHIYNRDFQTDKLLSIKELI
jgi:hypothetical protein